MLMLHLFGIIERQLIRNQLSQLKHFSKMLQMSIDCWRSWSVSEPILSTVVVRSSSSTHNNMALSNSTGASYVFNIVSVKPLLPNILINHLEKCLTSVLWYFSIFSFFAFGFFPIFVIIICCIEYLNHHKYLEGFAYDISSTLNCFWIL